MPRYAILHIGAFLFSAPPQNAVNLQCEKETTRLQATFDMLNKPNPEKTFVTQSEAKSLEANHVDVHEILHCTSFRSGWQDMNLYTF